MKRFDEFFVKLDIFGHPVGVLYRGKDRYRTRCGSIFTIATYMLILMNSIKLLLQWYSGNKLEFSTSFVNYDRFYSEKYYLAENGI